MAKISLPKQYPTTMLEWYRLWHKSLKTLGKRVSEHGSVDKARIRFSRREPTPSFRDNDDKKKTVKKALVGAFMKERELTSISLPIKDMIKRLEEKPWYFAMDSPAVDRAAIKLFIPWKPTSSLDRKFRKDETEVCIASIKSVQAPANCGAVIMTELYTEPTYRNQHIGTLLWMFAEYVINFYGRFGYLMATSIVKYDGMFNADCMRVTKIMERSGWTVRDKWVNSNSSNTLGLWSKLHPDHKKLKKAARAEYDQYIEWEEEQMEYDEEDDWY